MDIAPIPNVTSPEALEQKARPQGIQEPRLPKGHPLGTVQPHPLPLISSPTQTVEEPNDAAMRLRTAQTRSHLTGTGGIVDTIA